MRKFMNDKMNNDSRPPFLRAFTFSEEDYETARRKNGILELQLHVTQHCDLRCTYCSPHDRNKARMRAADPPPLSYVEICNVIFQAKELGVKTVHILGPGEPLLYPRLRDLVTFINRQDLTPYFPTNTLSLTRDFAQFCYDYGVNLLTKFNSLRADVQDRLAGRTGVHHVFENNLQMLIDMGFAKEQRLAAHCIISRLNYTDIPDVFIHLRRRGVIPFIDPLTMTGNATEELDVSLKEKRELFRTLAKIDEELFGYRWTISDFPRIGDDFRRYVRLCVVNMQGDVYPTDCLRVKLGLNVRTGVALRDMVRAEAFLESKRDEKHLRELPEEFWQEQEPDAPSGWMQGEAGGGGSGTIYTGIPVRQ